MPHIGLTGPSNHLLPVAARNKTILFTTHDIGLNNNLFSVGNDCSPLGNGRSRRLLIGQKADRN
jgi:hypothetical protein